MKRKLQVFISSTFTDLIEERQAAVSAILKSGHIPAGMELFTSGDRSQMDTITRWIDESDVYMLILGGRYGSVEPLTNLSYTELEFDYAVEQNKPMFSVVINEQALEVKVREHGTTFLEKNNPKELKLFREKVLSKISSFFDDTKDIKLCVHESLADFLNNRDLKGWVSGHEIVDTTPLFDEIKKLSEENTLLKETIAALEKPTPTAPEEVKGSDHQFSELIDTLKSIMIKVPAEISTAGEEYELSLLTIFYFNKDYLVAGITNSTSGNAVSKFLYYNICTKLQVYGLTDNEKVTGVRYRRCFVTSLGMKFLAHYEKTQLAEKKSKATTKETKEAKEAKELEKPKNEVTETKPAAPKKQSSQKNK